MAKLWTIQPLAVWRQLQAKRRLHSNANHFVCEPPAAYRWLRRQLKRRLPNYSGRHLWWAHCHKPDLRQHRHCYARAEEHVRIELDADVFPSVRFPCWAWNQVFCQDYLALDRREYSDWERRLRQAVPDEDVWPLPQPWRWELEASWQRLFSPDLPASNWDKESLFFQKPRSEAVFEVLRLDAVRGITVFKGTSSWLQKNLVTPRDRTRNRRVRSALSA